MTRLWTWYRARRLWVRLLIAGPAAVLALVLLYVVARGFQYAGASGMTAGDFEPDAAQVSVRCVDAAGHWTRISAGDAWKTVKRRILKEPQLRDALNGFLRGKRLPTLDDLDDRRFHDRTWGIFTEEMILRGGGRDAMAALRIGDRLDQTRFCAATKLGFIDYLGAPFAWIAPGLLGASKVQVNGETCLKWRGLHAALSGPFIVVSDDPELLGLALARQGKPGAPPRAARLKVRFDESAVLVDAKRLVRAFPMGILTTVADPGPMTSLTADFDVLGSDVVVEIAAEGLRPTSDAAAPVGPVRWVPSGGGGAITVNVDARPIWTWLEEVAADGSPFWSDLDKYGRQILRQILKQLKAYQFQTQVLPKVDGPLTVIHGTAPGSKGDPFGVLAFAFKSGDPAGVMEAISDISRKAIGERNPQVSWVRTEYQGYSMGYVDMRRDPFNYGDYKRPCLAIVQDTVVFANNLDFLRSVLDTAAGQATPFLDSDAVQAVRSRLERAGLKRVFGERLVASAFVNGPTLREGLEGYFPIWADSEVNTSENMRRLRDEVTAEFHRDGRPLNEDDVVRMVFERMESNIRTAEEEMRSAAKALDYLSHAAFESEATPGGLVIRATAGIQSR